MTIFRDATKSTKALVNTFVATFGVADGMHKSIVHNEVTLDELFNWLEGGLRWAKWLSPTGSFFVEELFLFPRHIFEYMNYMSVEISNILLTWERLLDLYL